MMCLRMIQDTEERFGRKKSVGKIKDGVLERVHGKDECGKRISIERENEENVQEKSVRNKGKSETEVEEKE